MPKTISKNSHSKIKVADTQQIKTRQWPQKNAPFTAIKGKKHSGKLLWLLNYQYQDSDLELFFN